MYIYIYVLCVRLFLCFLFLVSVGMVDICICSGLDAGFGLWSLGFEVDGFACYWIWFGA